MRRACLLLWLALLPGLAAGQSAEQSERELAEIRGRIEALQEEQAERRRLRDSAAEALREAEARLAEARRAAERTGAELAEAQDEQAELARRAAVAEAEAAAARERLAEQLRAHYYTGRQEALRLLLNQQDPARVGRMLVYYEYFNRHRSARLAGLREQLRSVQRLHEEARAASERLARLHTRRQSELREVETARDGREAALRDVEAELAAAGGELDALRAQEEELGELIERLRRELAGYPAEPQTPFESLRGELPWPVEGLLLHPFGQPRADGGGVQYNGLLLGAERGRDVQAVHYGRVVYADWLRGMGLLLVLDHGDGYMSLYGHNETLLREPGEWVAPGDVIAQVGDTGGQNRTGLYFEIRRGGQPVDPGPWLRAEAP